MAAGESLLHQRLQREQVRVRVLGQDSSHGVSQLKQVLCVLSAGTGGAGDLVGYLLQGGGAEVVGVVLRADVEQRLAGGRRVRRAGVKGHRDDLVATFFPVVQVALYFLLLAGGELVGHAPNASLDGGGWGGLLLRKN